ncbi:uncharacterized protein YALI1_C29910g [Yarrowia lipolytica]|uniref:Uncharacterized protein n=1 Tax=Yarrowia lipolytica TaxID=4952 RepID=A0A1D8NC51_YARLL|nr:hypothetical protein YALI1_C29910g [Yarrowia lipolytica]
MCDGTWERAIECDTTPEVMRMPICHEEPLRSHHLSGSWALQGRFPHTHKLINHSWYVSHCASKTLIYSLIKYKYKYKYDYCKESEPVWWRCLTVLCCTSDFRGDCG